MPLSEADKVALVYREIQNSDFDNSTGREAIEESDDYYFGRKPGSAADGRSQSVSMDCQDVCTATQGNIMESVSAEGFMRFPPQSDDDDVQAEVETLAVNSAMNRANGYLVKLSAVDNCLRYVNGAIRAWIDNAPETVTQRLPGATKTEAATVVAAFPDEFNASMDRLRGSDGRFAEGYKVTIEKPNSQLRLEAVNTAKIIMRKDWPSIDISEIDFFGIEHEDSRADMIEMGFPADVVDDLPEGREFFTEGAVNSKLQAEERSFTTAPDRSMDLITWFECWVKLPEGSGFQLSRAAVSNRKMLDESTATQIPVALGAAFPQAHRAQGISLVSKLIPVQVSKTEALRQYEDNLAASNNPRSLSYDVDMDDALNGRVDGVIRGNSPNARYEPIVVQDLSQGSLALLNYQDKRRSEAGGAALDVESAENQALDKQIGAVASQQVLMNQELRSVFIARNIANTLFKPLHFIVHKLMREEFNGQIMVRRADQFVPTTPGEWQPRELITEPVGLSPSQRNRTAANLFTIVQTQMSLAQSGSPMVDPDGMHAALQAWGDVVNLPINQYFTDPQSPKGQQAAQNAAQQAQQQQQMQMELAKLPLMIEQLKQQDESQRNQLDNAVEARGDTLTSEGKEAELVLKGLDSAQQFELDAAQAANPTNGAQQNGG